jgi:hypothetical protein
VVSLTETPKRGILFTGPHSLNPGGLFTGFRGWASLVLPAPARPIE